MLESKALINPQLLHSACQIYLGKILTTRFSPMSPLNVRWERKVV